jgi:hypothetical protein
MSEVAVLAGGCFWGVEDILRDVPGVLDTDVGCTGRLAGEPTGLPAKASGWVHLPLHAGVTRPAARHAWSRSEPSSGTPSKTRAISSRLRAS